MVVLWYAANVGNTTSKCINISCLLSAVAGLRSRWWTSVFPRFNNECEIRLKSIIYFPWAHFGVRTPGRRHTYKSWIPLWNFQTMSEALDECLPLVFQWRWGSSLHSGTGRISVMLFVTLSMGNQSCLSKIYCASVVWVCQQYCLCHIFP